jgi:hypothetical protein
MRKQPMTLILRALSCLAATLTPVSAAVATAHAQSPDSATSDSSSGSRQAEVAARGAGVMPFDLERPRHAFEPTADGGVLMVTARDPSDTTQVRLIREHLASASAAFARGDFSDPAFIHGDEMPGLAELRRGYGRIDVRGASLDDGARIVFSTQDPALVDAINRWFAAQTSDHGHHARP